MNIEILKNDKNEVELVVDNSTVTEILRSYLSEQGIEFVAWKREHPSKPVIFKIKSSGKTVNKAVSEVIEIIKKDCSKILSEIKK